MIYSRAKSGSLITEELNRISINIIIVVNKQQRKSAIRLILYRKILSWRGKFCSGWSTSSRWSRRAPACTRGGYRTGPSSPSWWWQSASTPSPGKSSTQTGGATQSWTGSTPSSSRCGATEWPRCSSLKTWWSSGIFQKLQELSLSSVNWWVGLFKGPNYNCQDLECW